MGKLESSDRIIPTGLFLSLAKKDWFQEPGSLPLCSLFPSTVVVLEWVLFRYLNSFQQGIWSTIGLEKHQQITQGDNAMVSNGKKNKYNLVGGFNPFEKY